MNRRIHILFVLLFLSLVAFSQNKKPIVASDLMKIATANQIQISPDGTKAIMVVTRKAVKNETDYYYTRHLYLLDLVAKNEPAQLTFASRIPVQIFQ